MAPLKSLFSGLPGKFEQLAEKAEAVASLTDAVKAELPETLRPHVVSAFRRETVLVVVVDSAAWSDRVRYAGRKLKAVLETMDPGPVSRVRVVVRPPVRP